MKRRQRAAIKATAYAAAIALVPIFSLTPQAADDQKSKTAGLFSDVVDGTDLFISCETTALAMNTSPFESSKGNVTVRVVMDGNDGEIRKGAWYIASIAGDHEKSFGMSAQETCKNGCTLRLATPPPEKPTTGEAAANQGGPPRPGRAIKPSTQLELWAPNPMGIDKLKPDQKLTIATFKVPSLDLKASVFEGRSPLIFEQGQCERVSEPPKTVAKKTEAPKQDAADTSDGQTPPATSETATSPKTETEQK